MTAHWKLAGLCTTEADPNDWFLSERNDSRATRQRVRDLKAICERCPVRERCLEASIENREPFGIWAGLTPSERDRVIRKREKEAAA